MIAINLKGTVLCTQVFFQHMCDRWQGHIVNIVSRLGKVGRVKFGGYAASKFVMLGSTETTDAEGIVYNVKATAVPPSAASTQQRAENYKEDQSKLLQAQDIAEEVPFIVTRPERVCIVEADITSQYMRWLPGTGNLKP